VRYAAVRTGARGVAPRRAGSRAATVAANAAANVVVELDCIPVGDYRLPGAARDGVLRRHGRAIARALHYGDECALVAAWQRSSSVRIRCEAPSHEAAEYAIGRTRYALGVDHDLRPFQREFRRDPLIGRMIRERPWLRPRRIAEPFQALAWAIAEQLIELDRAYAIIRRLTFRYGHRSPCGRFVDAPSPAAIAARAPAELQACDLSAGRSLAMILAAREVATGRADLHAADHESAWPRLLRIRGIGPWTIEKLAFHGQGRDDMLAAGDIAYLKLVGRLLDMPRRATVDEVRELFAPYEPYAGLAGMYALFAATKMELRPPGPAPVPVLS
jgi:DNA-3-methyladenine glycosylase II